MSINDVQKRSLRDVAVLQNRDRVLHKKMEAAERSVIIIGSKNSGKTSIIKQFVDKDRGGASSSSTYLLEYSYARQSGKSLVKDVCHIWELGSGTTFVSLLPAAFKTKQNRLIAVVLVLDLSAPETILNTVETLLETTRATVSEYVKEKPSPRLNISIEEEDKPHLKPFPIPLVVIGSKYDIFQNLEPSKKRIMCQYLRCLCHISQADLIFSSNNDTSLIKRTRDTLLHYGFGISVLNNTTVVDYNKPLRIFAGSDSFSSIHGSSSTTVNYSLDKYKNSLIVHFKQDSSNKELIPDDPAADSNFEETVVDNLCKQKMEEFKRMKEDQVKKIRAVQSLKRSV